MHAIELRRQAQVGPVIHDEISAPCAVGHSSLREQSAQFPRLLQHHARIPTLVAVLQQGATARDKFVPAKLTKSSVVEKAAASTMA